MALELVLVLLRGVRSLLLLPTVLNVCENVFLTRQKRLRAGGARCAARLACDLESVERFRRDASRDLGRHDVLTRLARVL